MSTSLYWRPSAEFRNHSIESSGSCGSLPWACAAVISLCRFSKTGVNIFAAARQSARTSRHSERSLSASQRRNLASRRTIAIPMKALVVNSMEIRHHSWLLLKILGRKIRIDSRAIHCGTSFFTSRSYQPSPSWSQLSCRQLVISSDRAFVNFAVCTVVSCEATSRPELFSNHA